MKAQVQFWVVTKPTPLSVLDDILFQSDPVGMMYQALGGLRTDDVLFSSLNYEDARVFADKTLSARPQNS